MKKWKCTVCGYIYDESKGIPENGIPAGTKFEDLPDDFTCPWCGAPKSVFEEIEEEKSEKADFIEIESDGEMKKWKCTVCGYIYDESKGIPENGIPAGTKFEDLPDDFTCPWCGAPKSVFEEIKEEKTEKTVPAHVEEEHDEKELSFMEISIICSNLARGCEKQYMPEESEKFTKLAEHFKNRAKKEENPDMSEILKLVNKDLESAYPIAYEASENDRGAKRALVWSEKVSRMLKSLLERYEKEGNKITENTGVYVCTICGFIFVGDKLPVVCPVCKVPNKKFVKIEGRA